MADLVVAGVGPVGWEAGTDLFLDVVRRLGAPSGWRPVWFGRRSCGAARRADVDARLLGLDGLVEWREERPPSGLAVAAVTARTPRAAREALADLGDATVVAWGVGLLDPPPEGGSGRVEFPDTAAMAAAVRDALVAAGAGSAP